MVVEVEIMQIRETATNLMIHGHLLCDNRRQVARLRVRRRDKIQSRDDVYVHQFGLPELQSTVVKILFIFTFTYMLQQCVCSLTNITSI